MNIKLQHSTVTVGDIAIILSYEYGECVINTKISGVIVHPLHLSHVLYMPGEINNLLS